MPEAATATAPVTRDATKEIGFGDADLLDCIRNATAAHRRLIAVRRGIGEVVAEALVEPAEPPVIEALLKNSFAKLSAEAVEMLVAASRSQPRIISLLLPLKIFFS